MQADALRDCFAVLLPRDGRVSQKRAHSLDVDRHLLAGPRCLWRDSVLQWVDAANSGLRLRGTCQQKQAKNKNWAKLLEVLHNSCLSAQAGHSQPAWALCRD